MARFYVASKLTNNTILHLPSEVVRHLNVLRSRIGDTVNLFNGNGFDYITTILELNKRHGQVEINSAIKLNNESKLTITLLMCIINNDRFDLVLQKTVELGVTKVVPIISQYVQRVAQEKLATRFEHWRKVIIAASEQSGRATLMQLDCATTLECAIRNHNSELNLILSPHHNNEAKITSPATSVTLLIGPEGGFTTTEITMAQQAQFKLWQIGPRILRAETAALAGISIIQNNIGDLCYNFNSAK